MVDQSVPLSVAVHIRQDPEGLAESWVDVLRADPICQPVALYPVLQRRLAPLLLAVAEALESGALHLADSGFRSTVREFAFIGGWLAGQGANASLAVRSVSAFADAVHRVYGVELYRWPPWRPLEGGLTAVALETYCRSIHAGERDSRLEMLERCTPILRLPNDLPALLVVGNPSRQVLSALLGRLLMEVARLGAETLIVDFTNARDLEDDALSVMLELLDHRKLQERVVCLAALTEDQQRRLRRELGGRRNFRFCESWTDAVKIDKAG